MCQAILLPLSLARRLARIGRLALSDPSEAWRRVHARLIAAGDSNGLLNRPLSASRPVGGLAPVRAHLIAAGGPNFLTFGVFGAITPDPKAAALMTAGPVRSPWVTLCDGRGLLRLWKTLAAQ